MSLRRSIRATVTLLALGACLVAAGLDGTVRLRGEVDARARARWQQKWGARILRVLRVRVMVSGEPPSGGMLVANHLGYLDIPVLAARQGLAFVAKAEVRGWPGLGRLVAMAGTRFVVRERRGDVVLVGDDFARAVEAGVLPAVFLEGTSTAGETVRPFKPALLEPAIRRGWRVTPVALDYHCEGGTVVRDVCWWGEMSLLPHLWRLAGLKGVIARVRYGRAVSAGGGDRKALARDLHAAVVGLREGVLSQEG